MVNVQVHGKAAPFRNKAFPHLESLSIVWAKDRAIGEEVRSPAGFEEEVVEEQTVNLEVDDDDVAATRDVDIATNTHASHASSCTRKRKRPNNADLFADVLRETIGALDQTIVAAIDNLGEKLSNRARQAHLDEKANELYMDLLTVEGLTTREVNAAHIKLAAAPQLLGVFGRVPAEYKASWIRSLLSG